MGTEIYKPIKVYVTIGTTECSIFRVCVISNYRNIRTNGSVAYSSFPMYRNKIEKMGLTKKKVTVE